MVWHAFRAPRGEDLDQVSMPCRLLRYVGLVRCLCSEPRAWRGECGNRHIHHTSTAVCTSNVCDRVCTDRSEHTIWYCTQSSMSYHMSFKLYHIVYMTYSRTRYSCISYISISISYMNMLRSYRGEIMNGESGGARRERRELWSWKRE